MTTYQNSLFPEVKRKIVERSKKPRTVVARVLHLGAGVQSSCIAEMVLAGELPPVDLVIFADTGNEPPWVYKQVRYLAARFKASKIPFLVVRATPGGLVADAMS